MSILISPKALKYVLERASALCLKEPALIISSCRGSSGLSFATMIANRSDVQSGYKFVREVEGISIYADDEAYDLSVDYKLAIVLRGSGEYSALDADLPWMLTPKELKELL